MKLNETKDIQLTYRRKLLARCMDEKFSMKVFDRILPLMKNSVAIRGEKQTEERAKTILCIINNSKTEEEMLEKLNSL